MRGIRQILAVLMGGALLSLGLALAFAAFLILVVFRDGPMTPRSYSDQEKIEKRWDGITAGAGAVASLAGGVGLLWWGLRRRE